MAGRHPTGRGGGGRRSGPPTSPPPLPPPSLRATGATHRPPRSRGDAPPPPEGTATREGGGDAAGPAHRAPQRPQPPAPAGVAADGRAHTSAPERRADQAWGPCTAAHQNSMEAAPPMTPPMTIAHSGRAEGGFRTEGAPGGAVHGPPLILPPPRGGPATPTGRARRCGAAVSLVCLRPLLGLRKRGGESGGPSGPLVPPPDGRGGAAWRSRPRGPAVDWGVALFPRPPLPRAGPSCRFSLGPLVPPAVATRRWPAGGGREG